MARIRGIERNAVRRDPRELHWCCFMNKLDRKLLRDLLRMKMQLAAVGGVLACGMVLWVMANGMYDSLQRARDGYYDASQYMADMAVGVVRAPLDLVPQLQAMPGVQSLEARVAGVGLLDLPQRQEPVSARMVSLPPGREPRVNQMVLRAGRLPDPAPPRRGADQRSLRRCQSARTGHERWAPSSMASAAT